MAKGWRLHRDQHSHPMTCRMSRSRASTGSSSSSTVLWTARTTGKARGHQVPCSPLQIAALRPQGTRGGGRSGDITADYHSPCLLPMSTSTSWKLSGPSACGGQSLRHQAWTPNSPRTPTGPAGPTAAYTPDVRAAGEPPAPWSRQCSVGSHGWTRRPHPPCREQSQELGSHGPHPSQLPPADPGPWAWVSLEPGRVDLQDFLGVGHSADDPGLG